MESSEVECLLALVTVLDRTLDRYLAKAAQPCEAMPQINETCGQMRSKTLSDGMKYWLQAIEHHAAEIVNPRKRSGEDAAFLSSNSFLGLQLLKDIYYLRVQLLGARGAKT